MAKRYWLVKSDPDEYGWPDLVRDGGTRWDGVRNHQARNQLAAMQVGDPVLIYHSGKEKAVVGLAEVTAGAEPDPTAEDPRWVAVALAPRAPLARPVTLATIKADPALEGFALVRQSRLSVMPVTAAEFRQIRKLGR